MRQSIIWRALLALSLPLSLTLRNPLTPTRAIGHTASHSSPSVHTSGLSVADIQRLSADANQRVIVILRNQYANLPARGATRSMRAAVVATDQQSVLGELSQIHAPRVRAYRLINAVAATVSSAEVARLRANPTVQSVVPDRMIQAPPHDLVTGGGGTSVSPASALPPCTFSPLLEPEALQLTSTAFTDTVTPQAQSIVTGTGVTVAFIADGVDPTNPDFIRPNGSNVFVDYQDFSGDGPSAPTSGGEAFGDASSIAAQGNNTYNVNAYVNTAHRRPDACPQIKVLGMAPGASLIGLKAFGQNNQSPTSNFVQAIEYAVVHGANVLNESFGSNPYPDTTNDPISLADAAATAAGVTVIASSGDAGTAGTIGSPATDAGVIAVGGTTQFRLYSQIDFAGIQLGSGGYVSNNISSLSSAGPAYSGRQTVDVVAPGDLGWAVCTPNPTVYFACSDSNGRPTSIFAFGGTSESAPLTAGEAALVIQAYRQAHSGVDPTPALIKRIIKSTATDLNIPANEQGAGLIDSLKAVRAALSYQDEHSAGAAAQGDALLVSPGTLAAEGVPNTPRRFTVQVTNSGGSTQTVTPRVKTLGTPGYHQSFTVDLTPTASSTGVFTDSAGIRRAYVEQDFTVPAKADRLDAAIAFDVTKRPYALARVSLFDPQNRLTAYSLPQDAGFPNANSGYGHVDVHDPLPGTYRAIIFTVARPNGYSGPVHLDVSTSNFVTTGDVTPATRALAPGETGSFVVSATTPAQPGDESAQLAISGTTTDAGAVPIILRSLVPTSQTPAPATTTFTGTLTGGNGRADSPGQALTYAFDVPAGLRDLDLGVALSDTGYNLQGVLVDPNGVPIDVQSTVTATDRISTSPTFGQPTGYTNTMQFFRRDPQAGRWHVILTINDNTSGQQTSLPFTVAIAYNGVRVAASSVPSDASVTLPTGAPVSVPVTVTNTGNTTKDFFVDPRLAHYTPLSLGGSTVDVPLTSVNFPPFFVPTESRNLTIAAEAVSPSVPISMDILDANGAPPFGNPKPAFQETGSPDIEATSFLDPFTGFYAAVASASYPEVPSGVWLAAPTLIGPYSDPGATPTTVILGGIVDAQPFDAAAVPSTGDLYAREYAQQAGDTPPTAPYHPLTLAPGQTGVVTVTITPAADSGAVVDGFLYVDAVNVNSDDPATGSPNLTTGSGDELAVLPYTYTVGAPATATDTGTPAVTATISPTATVSVSATATVSGTATVSVSATTTGTIVPPTATSTAVPATSTAVPATSTAVPATSTGTAIPVTSTRTDVSATATGTAVPATNTSTAMPATSTSTDVPATATGTEAPSVTTTPGTAGAPTLVCQLFALPAFDPVPRGGEQALVIVAAPGSPITATIRAGYPVSATLYTDSSLDGSDGFGTTITGTRVPGGYRYAFRVETSGFALLTFTIPRDARLGTVATRLAAQEPCGAFKTSVTFQVRGIVPGGGTAARTTGRVVTLTLTLPPGDKLPASAGRLMRHGVVRVITHSQGHGRAVHVTRTLLLIYHPRAAHAHGHVMHSAARRVAHKGGTLRTSVHALGSWALLMMLSERDVCTRGVKTKRLVSTTDDSLPLDSRNDRATVHYPDHGSQRRRPGTKRGVARCET